MTASQSEQKNGSVELYRGAYIHAYNPKSNNHEYGVIVEITPKRVIISNEESDWEPRIWLSKNEVYGLSEEQWALVGAEQRRRRTEYETAKKAGKARDVADYSKVEIDV